MIKNYFIMLTLLSFSACSFKPLYAVKHENPATESIKLGAVNFGSYPGKIDYTFRSELSDMLETIGGASQKKYTLNVTLGKTLTGFGTQQNTINTRNLTTLSASYTLYNINTGKKIVSGVHKIIDSFEVSVSPYSTYVADEETSIKLAKNLAHELMLRLESEIIRAESDAAK